MKVPQVDPRFKVEGRQLSRQKHGQQENYGCVMRKRGCTLPLERREVVR